MEENSLNLTESEMKSQIELYQKLCENVKEFAEIKEKLWELEHKATDLSWRNTSMVFWKAICNVYDPKDLLNCYGDIFFILERHGDTYIGQRVLWNLSLSKERYIIEEVKDIDCYGEYNAEYYNIDVILNND